MRKVFVALTAAFALVAFLSACGMGLEPAKTDTTSVSLSLTVMSPLGSGGSTDAGRAIIPDGGYLYVRMLGGPTADTPSFLGPYQVTATTSMVSITDIPAGQYDGMFLLYADRAVHDEEVTIEGVATTLGQIFSLPDKDFLAFVEGYEEYEVEIPTEPIDEELFYEPHPVDVLLAGRASIGMVESPRVVDGVANSFRSTMLPVTPYWIPVAFEMFGNPMYLNELLNTFDGTVYESFKGFVGIPALQMIISSSNPGYTGDVTLTFSNESETDTMTVNSLSVYDAEGVRTAAAPGPYPVTMTAGQKYALTVPVPDSVFDEIFFYLDVSGGDPAITITLDEDVTEEPEYPIPEELEPITGSLNLGEYAYNFDEITSVMFCTADPATWFNGTLSEGEPPSQVVAIATLSDSGYGSYSIDGVWLDSSYDGQSLYLLVSGLKYETVVWFSTEQMTVNSSNTIYMPVTMTPLIQYLIVYRWFDGTGLSGYNNYTSVITLSYGTGPVSTTTTLYSTVTNLTEGPLSGYYVSVFPIVDEYSAFMQLESGMEYSTYFQVWQSPADPAPSYEYEFSIYLESGQENNAFIEYSIMDQP